MKKPAGKSPYRKPDEALSGFPDISLEAISPDPPRADPGSPFQSPDRRVALHAWLGLVVRAALVAGALFTVVQYLETRREKRIERTLDLVETWERAEYQEAQGALRDRLAALNQRYGELIGKNATPSELAIFQARIGMEALAADGGTMPVGDFRDRFDRILYFLNRMAACVNGGLCERDLADEFFAEFAASFWRYFSAHVDAVRKSGQPAYALAIQTYVGARK